MNTPPRPHPPYPPLTDAQWLGRLLPSAGLLLSGLLFMGYAMSQGWPVWCGVFGFLVAGSGLLFLSLALTSWLNDRRTRLSVPAIARLQRSSSGPAPASSIPALSATTNTLSPGKTTTDPATPA